MPGFDAGAVLERVRSWGVEAPVARAVTLVEDRLHPDRHSALAGWARSYVPGPLDGFLMRCYTSTASRSRRQLGDVALIPRWRGRTVLLHAWPCPSAASCAPAAGPGGCTAPGTCRELIR